MSTNWRWKQGWSERELEEAIGAARGGASNLTVPPERMTPAHGWNHVESEAVIGREGPGEPEPQGAYARGRRSLELFEFSDPRIVIGHFDERDALLGRTVLLELQCAGFRFLSPVRVSAVEERSAPEETRFRFSFETLDGHLERGLEWFILTKDHRTGEVRLRIEAAWREGSFPAWWAYAGFLLFGRRLQRAWHLLAHERMRRLLSSGEVVPLHGPRLTHSGHPIHTAPVHFRSLRGVQQEQMRRDRLLRIAGLGGLCGLRTFTAPAVLVTRLQGASLDGAPALLEKVLASRWSPAVLIALAAGEWAADKLPNAPDRTRAPGLIGRACAGAFVGYVLAVKGERRPLGPAVLGAAAASAGAFLGLSLRRMLSRRVVREPFAGVIEDLLTLGASVALAARAR